MKPSVSLLASCLLLSACAVIPPEAYSVGRGDPESLLDVSSEVVNLDISSESALHELGAWVNEDAPSRAELYCVSDSPFCMRAKELMDVYDVPYRHVPSAEFSAALIYERVLARDCENRYIDNSINPYHLNHPSLGCSIAVNIVQHVTDKRQFVRPNLMDMPDAVKANQVYDAYLTPVEYEAPEGISESLTSQAAQ